MLSSMYNFKHDAFFNTLHFFGRRKKKVQVKIERFEKRNKINSLIEVFLFDETTENLNVIILIIFLCI